MKYRAEILGRVPNGLTHNEVYATVLQVLNESEGVESVTKRRLAGNHVSVIAIFDCDSPEQGAARVQRAARSVTGFSFDTFGRVIEP